MVAAFDTATQREHFLLAFLARSDGPVGSGVLWQEFHKNGEPVSEPTVGRWLRWLDMRGYTAKVSNLGRTLTPAGRARLSALDEQFRRTTSEATLLQTIRTSTIGEILDVLIARRAIEREIARLAAVNATAERIQQMERIIEEQREQLALHGQAVQADIAFHHALAEAAGNRVLTAALDLIRHDLGLQSTLEHIRRQRHSVMVVDHIAILDAVQARLPDDAERAMLDHVDKIIDEIIAYRRQVTGD